MEKPVWTRANVRIRGAVSKGIYIQSMDTQLRIMTFSSVITYPCPGDPIFARAIISICNEMEVSVNIQDFSYEYNAKL